MNTSEMEKVILVDSSDNETGTLEKMEAHKKALLHRAISVFIINSKGEWLLQRRSLDKYHSKGLWTNTCCSHPHPGETALQAAHRRLFQEMSMKTSLKKVFWFIYKENLDHDLTEHELDHVFIGISDDHPVINKNEVLEWKYISIDDLRSDIKSNPDKYTVWFKMIYEKVHEHIVQAKPGAIIIEDSGMMKYVPE